MLDGIFPRKPLIRFGQFLPRDNKIFNIKYLNSESLSPLWPNRESEQHASTRVYVRHPSTCFVLFLHFFNFFNRAKNGPGLGFKIF